MAFTIQPVSAIFLVSGALILAVGLFVLLARPSAAINRAFFVLALFDGLSTILFELREMSTTAYERVLFMGLYWDAFIVFNGMVLAFGLAYPHSIGGARGRHVGNAIAAGLTLGMLILYNARHDLFWRAADIETSVRFVSTPLGRATTAFFVLAPAFLIIKVLLAMRRGNGGARERQAAWVLGAMILGYAPFATTELAAWGTGAWAALLEPARPQFFAVWVYAAVVLTVLAVAVLVVRAPPSTPGRRLMLGIFGVVGLLTLAATLGEPARLGVQAIALASYPVLLGYAIVRYEVFDIDRKLRRAATVSIVAATLGIGFVLAENTAEDLLTPLLDGVLPPAIVSNGIAALAAAASLLPLAALVRRLTGRVLPELAQDQVEARKLDVYRHAVEGAFADGFLDLRESRTLRQLREALGLSEAAHDRVIAEISRATS